MRKYKAIASPLTRKDKRGVASVAPRDDVRRRLLHLRLAITKSDAIAR